ncbi:MAG: DUF1189 family protein [Rickettsiaceae bacterium]|nr:DUF1189 family protein [Rickettsiaceae bacterium]
MTIYFSQFYQFILILTKILWCSVSSPQFYYNVYNSYKGYGAKYVLVLSTIAAFILSIFLLNYNNNLMLYLRYNQEAPNVQGVAALIEEFPSLQYDGKSLTFSDPVSDNIMYISNKIFVVDVDNTLNPSELMKIPVVLRKNNIHINFLDNSGKIIENFIINYQDIIGTTAINLDSAYLQNQILDIVMRFPRVIIYNIFPIASILIYFNIIFEKVFLILAIFFFSKLLGYNNNLKSAIRVVLFSSGFTILFGYMSLWLPTYVAYSIYAIQIWINFLILVGIFKDKLPIKIFI